MFKESETEQPVTIPPAAEISEVIAPIKKISTDTWVRLTIFPDDQKWALQLMDGKTISLFIPLQISGSEDHNVNLRITVRVAK